MPHTIIQTFPCMGQNGLRVGFNGHSHIFTSPLQRQKPQMARFFDYLLFFLIQFLIKKAEGFPSAFAMRTDEPRVSAFHAALGCLKRVDLLFGFTCNFGDAMPVLLKQAVRIKAQCIQSGSHIFTVSDRQGADPHTPARSGTDLFRQWRGKRILLFPAPSE